MACCVICNKVFKLKRLGDEAVCSDVCASVTKQARDEWRRAHGIFMPSGIPSRGVNIDRIHRLRA